MTSQTQFADVMAPRPSFGEATGRSDRAAACDPIPDFEPIEPLTVPAVAECAEAVVEALNAPVAAAPALLGGLGAATGHVSDALTRSGSRGAAVPPAVRLEREPDARPPMVGAGADARAGEPVVRAVSVDEYAKAVLYNGLGHYQAARIAAERACECADFALLDGALYELVESSARSGRRWRAVQALRRLDERAQATGSQWAMGMAACARALLCDDERAETAYLEAMERLSSTCADVALARARLLYGEWLRRQGRRVDSRQQLALAHRAFCTERLGGFADRARRELLATGGTVRKRRDDTRLDLTSQEAQIAQLAAGGWTNPEIGERLFLSPRTVEWHLRKVFIKLGVKSRKELKATVETRPVR